MTSSTNPNYSSSRRLVTAFFDSRGEAEDAIESLVDAGVSRDSIRFMPGDERDLTDASGTSAHAEPRGFWDSLGDWLLPDDDRSTYAEGLRRGGYLLSVDASDSQYEAVIDILDDEGTIDIDERAEFLALGGLGGRDICRCPVRFDGQPDHRRGRDNVRDYRPFRSDELSTIGCDQRERQQL